MRVRTLLVAAVVGLAWLLGGHASSASATCPLQLEVGLDKPAFTSWEIATGRVSISNRNRRAVPASAVVFLFKEGRLVHWREVPLSVPAGRHLYDLTTALGFVPVVSATDLVGSWRLAVEVRSSECKVSSEATFRVEQSQGRRTMAWRGLVGYWPFDEGEGLRAADWSGGGHDAEVLGGKWTDGNSRKALAFDGQSTGVRLPAVQAPGSGGMTLVFWIWPEEMSSLRTVFSRPVPSKGSQNGGWAFVLQGREPSLWLRGTDGAPRLLGFVPGRSELPSRTWTQVALVQAGRMFSLYLNGRVAGSVSALLPTGRGGDIFLGRAEAGLGGASLKGRVNQVRVFDRPLSPDELQADYEAAFPASVDVSVDPGTQIGEISPLIYGLNVEGNDPFVLPRGLGITNVRWPGGCFAEGYHWRSAVGPAHARRARGAAVCEGDQMSSTPARTDVGPDEFMLILQGSGAVPHLTANFAAGNAQEAANWVEYMNAPSPGLQEGIGRGWTSSSYGGGDKAPPGYFAWLREFFGSRSPYGVKFWAVGNEFQARSTPSWTRDAKQYYLGGVGRSISHWMTRDPTRTDWSIERRMSTGRPSAEFFAPFVPALPGSQRVEVVPALRRDPLELGSAKLWKVIPDLNGARRDNVYQFVHSEGRVLFGDGAHGNILPKDSLVRITYNSGPHDGFVEFARKMRAVDPSIRVGTSAAFSPIPPEAAPDVDFVAANLYPSLARNDPDPVRRYYRIQAAPVAEFEPRIRAAQEALRGSISGKLIQLALTEYNHDLASPHLRSLASGLFVADMLRVLAKNGVPIANYYALHLLTPQGVASGGESPPATIFRLYRTHFGKILIAATARTVPLFEGVFDGRKVTLPLLEVLATLEGERQTVYLMTINKHVERTFALAARIVGWQGRIKGRIFQLGGDHPFDEVATLTVGDLEAPAGVLRWTVPQHSVTVVEVRRAE